MSIAEIGPLILAYKYFIIFPLAILEGPFLTILCGFFASLGFLNPLLVFLLVVVADTIGDSIYYCIGHFGGKKLLTSRFGRFLGVTESRMERAEKFYENHQGTAIALSKLIQGVGTTGLVAAGALSLSYKRFIRSAFIISIAQSAVFIAFGFFFGNAYVAFNHKFGLSAAITLAILLIVLFYFLVRLIMKIMTKKF